MSTIQAAIYARVSSERQATAQTIASPRAALRERVAADGCAVPEARQFLADGYSGTTLVRPALERWRALVAAGAVDRLSLHSPARLARKYAYQVLWVDEFHRAGVAVRFLKRDLGRSPEDDRLLQVQGLMAEYERAKIVERHRRGKLHAARASIVNVLAGAPYGYRYLDKHAGGGQARYEVLPAEARVVRQGFEWVGRDRLTIGEVGRRLTQAGERTRTGRTVGERSVVGGSLHNAAYPGTAAFGKTRQGPLRPRRRAQRGRPPPPRRATAAYDVLASEWLPLPVPALIDGALCAAVQEQGQEPRRHARQSRRGVRDLLQGLVHCQPCGYAFYGKPLSRKAAKGKPRAYADYRCLGTDAYRLGGERVCTNSQVRTDRLDVTVWREVQGLLAPPERVAEQYQRRLHTTTAGTHREQVTLEAQLGKVRQGLARLMDRYAEGLLEKHEFDPRITRLRQRITQLEEQRQQRLDVTALQTEIRLIVGRLEDFAAKIEAGLEDSDWLSKREMSRALVKRVEVPPDRVNGVFRVDPYPGEASPEKKGWQLYRGSSDAPLRCAGRRFGEHAIVEHPGLEPRFHEAVQGRECRDLAEEGLLVDPIEALRAIGVQGVLGLLFNRDEDRPDGVVDGSTGSESIAVGFEPCFPFRFKDEFDEGLECPIVECGNRKRALFVFARLRNPHPSGGSAGRQCAELSRQGTTLVGCERFDSVNPRGVLALVVLGDATDCEPFRSPRLQEEFLESVDSADISRLRGFVAPPCELTHRYLQLAPGELVPCIRSRCRLAHDVFTLLGSSPCRSTARLSAYPPAFPEA